MTVMPTRQADDQDAIAALANKAAYDLLLSQREVNGSPHIKHAMLRALYSSLLSRVLDRAGRDRLGGLRVLDLGAGDGMMTLLLLELGMRVTAVDISSAQIESLKQKTAQYASQLDARCQDVAELLNEPQRYDLIVANSFLHHVPDYLGMLKLTAQRISPGGQFFSFQDPLWHDSVGALNRAFSLVAYFFWRIFQGDVAGGVQRKLRRAKGVYLSDCMYDNAEYHVVRKGVNQEAIAELFRDAGFECEIIPYFSAHSGLFQRMGSAMQFRNTFSVIARKVA